MKSSIKIYHGVLAVILSVCSTLVQAKNYYFSFTGNDAFNGRSAARAWKTLSPLQKIKLQPGDSLLFRRGDSFEGTIRLLQSGTKDHPIVIAPYGKGADPVLSGAIKISNWKAIGDNRYEATVNQQVLDVFGNGERYTPARFPNSGFLTIDKGFGKDSIACNQLLQQDGYFDGANLRIRTIDWVYETRTVAAYQKGLIIQGRQNRYPIEESFRERTQAGKTGVYYFQKGYGFFVEGLAKMIDTAYEWAWHQNKLLLQLPQGQSIAAAAIKVVVYDYGVWLPPGTKHVVVSGLQFIQYEKAGVGGGWHLSNIAVQNNQFKQIHGMGVLLDSASSNCIITRNDFSDILGRGISALEAVGMEITDNHIKRIGMERGYGWSGVNGATGILIHNVERPIQTDTTFAHHNVVRNNRVDSCGYNGIRVDGSYNLVTFNVIDHCSLTLNDGANLYCFGKGPGVTHHSVFSNNIVRYSIGDSRATPGNSNLAFGIYLDNNSSDMLVEGNTVIATGAAGILNNDASFNNTIRNNTIVDCTDGLGFSEWANLGKIFGMVVERNVVVGLSPHQKSVNMTNWISPQFNIGSFVNNQYVNLTATAIFKYTSKQIPEATKLDLSFEQWKRIVNNDFDSKAITATTGWALGKAPDILVNDTPEIKMYDLKDSEYFFIDGNKAATQIVLPPFKSIVLLKAKR